jgi:hypothetical protein
LKYTEERNDAQHELTKKTTKENLENLQGRTKALKKEKRKTKMRWQNKLARGRKDDDFTMTPKEAWQEYGVIEKGSTGHLPTITPAQICQN